MRAVRREERLRPVSRVPAQRRVAGRRDAEGGEAEGGGGGEGSPGRASRAGQSGAVEGNGPGGETRRESNRTDNGEGYREKPHPGAAVFGRGAPRRAQGSR
ncbi:unnamed protein product, partial [Ectocarpus sp. 8 AP-2014]